MKITRKALRQLGTLQAEMIEREAERTAALRMLLASRAVTTPPVQREYFFEFVWLDQDYRVAVKRVADFCGSVGNLR